MNESGRKGSGPGPKSAREVVPGPAWSAGRAGRKLLAAVTAGGLLLAGAGMAQADIVSNDLDASVDAVAENMPLNAGGAAGTTTLAIGPVNGDGKNGCNLTGSTELTLSLVSSNTAAATVSPSSVTFTSCGGTKLVTVTPVAAGTATVSATQTFNDTGGTFDLEPATFTVNVAAPAPANTAPTLTLAGVSTGASYAKGSVPAASCNIVDAEDGDSTFAATLSDITGPYKSDGIGEQTASCSYTDGGGLTASGSATYAIVDPSGPQISYTLTPGTPNGLSEWFTVPLNLSWTVTEPESPTSLTLSGCEDQAISADQAKITYVCSASSAGGTASTETIPVGLDATAPSVAYSGADRAPDANGWYIAPVTATFTATDSVSGPAETTQTATSAGEGAAVVVRSPAFEDIAGNTAEAGTASASYSIDLTDPVAAFDSVTADAYFGFVGAEPTCTATDEVSGPAGCVVTGYSPTVGVHTLTATATDNAGRTSTATHTYTVKAWETKGFYQPIDMGGNVVNTVKAGSTVPAKFELFAGSTELTATNIVTMGIRQTACSPLAVQDGIEITASGNTSLRYDSTGGQYIYNWKTPNMPGACFQLSMVAADGSHIEANFKLK